MTFASVASVQPVTTGGRLLTSSEVAERLGIHRVSVYRHVRDGTLEARRLGPNGPLRFEPEAVERFLGPAHQDEEDV